VISSREHPVRSYHDIIAAVLVIVIMADVSRIVWRKYRQPEIQVGQTDTFQFSSRVNPNEAAAVDIECLPGLNEKLAKAIVDYRGEYQRRYPLRLVFANLQDLKRIKGISDKLLLKISPYLFFPPKPSDSND
jgi:DNA uptake protein ComE-like DNA-binding protein